MSDIKSYLNETASLLAQDQLELSDSADSLGLLLSKALSKQTVSKRVPVEIAWGAERYNLQRCEAYLSLEPARQVAMLRRITELNLALSYFIEKSGFGYGAKMILLADSVEEKSLYSLFVADEAVHLQEFKNHMDFIPTLETHSHPMLGVLSEAIRDGEKQALVFVIQVLLEGFGLAHYADLRQDCQNESLKGAYTRILQDEARHHGAGIILAKSRESSKHELDQIFEYSRKFIVALRQAGWIKQELERQRGIPLSTAESARFLDETGQVAGLERRMARLREMIEKVDQFGVLARLDADGAFKVGA